MAGDWPLRSLLEEGDFGIGTFNDLDGEMVVLDGIVYQVRGDGSVHQPPLDTFTPFACVCEFDKDDAVALPTLPEGADFLALQGQIDAALPSLNLFYAVRVEGTFKELTVRSVHAQPKPYPPLAEVVNNQSVFRFEDIRGTLVGFRCPAYAKGINVPGYHFHFLSEDKQSGGHVLSLTLGEVEASYLKLAAWEVLLPETSAFLQAPLGQDVSDVLKAVETAKE